MSIEIGDALRTAREEQGRSLDEASRETRVRRDYLEALEVEDFGRIGSDVYAKGFLTTYARWLGLDPEPLLDRYRRFVQSSGYDPHALIEHPVARSSRSGPPAWLVWAGVMVLVLLAAFAVIGTLGGRSPQQADQPDPGRSSPTPTAPESSPEDTEEPSPTPSPSPTSVELAVLLEEASWMRVVIGGEEVFQGTLRSGETRQFQAPDAVEIRFGNPGGVRLVLNGDDLGSPGARGDPITVVCTPEGCTPAEGEDA